MKKFILILSLISLWFYTDDSYSCTIFYIEKNGLIYAGNNEDWKDPLSCIWFYPAKENSHGWIKFGWGSGFPQGGVNDQGLFWDATSCSHLDMPYSEANKTLLNTPVMQKIIQECKELKMAKETFKNYYCDDQYKAQYLLGDSTGKSMIVEGDNIIDAKEDYQVLTNFYQSHPELGGYPCWRYETAIGMLENTVIIDPYTIGSVLSATHQEGKYPTQYSVIYNLKNLEIFIFHFHNFQEFLFLDIISELDKGYRTFSIPELFSSVTLIYPSDNERITGNEFYLRWRSKSGNRYRVMYSQDQDFKSFSCHEINNEAENNSEKKRNLSIICFSPLLIGLAIRKRRFIASYTILLFILIIPGCVKEDPQPGENEIIEMSLKISNLEVNTRYYWKIQAWNPEYPEFTTETIVKSFQFQP